MGSDDEHEIAGTGLRARIKAHGAELCALQDYSGRAYLWPAAPVWPRHAPVLFPIVGRLKNDTLMHQGQAYRMTQHGFARDVRFDWIDRTHTACRLALSDDPRTRAMYPFVFRLEVEYAIVDAALGVTFEVFNTGSDLLPASIGAHPAFRWPIAEGVAKTAHTLTFETNEPAPIRVVQGGLVTPERRASPVRGRELRLAPDLFARDALIFEQPQSRSVRYAGPGTPALTVSWEGFEQLGIWSREGGDFVCIEPWRGMASPEEFGGEFMDKPWLMLVPPGQSARLVLRVEISAGAGQSG